MDKISAVILAGYNNKWEVKRYAKMVAEHYDERYIESGYKPLREFKTVKDGQVVSKPLIQYTLETLSRMDSVEDIIIVGHQMLLEQSLGNLISNLDKPCSIINQNSKLSDSIIKQFDIIPRRVKYTSIAGNLIKGYAASKACEEKTHALFIASDSPLTTREFLENFLQIAQKYQEKADLFVPAVFIEGERDKLGRVPLKLINDTEFEVSKTKDVHGRQGFRLSPLVYVNPHCFDVNAGNTAYSLRKLINPNIQLKLFKITRGLGYANVYSKYFLRRDLSVREVENISTAFFNGRLKLIPILGEEATYDYDGTDREYRLISKMLTSN
jgi:hypothetical protein